MSVFIPTPGEPLTPREREVVALMAQGRSEKEAASDLQVSIKTVQKHRQTAYTKLGVHDRVMLTHWAIAEGIVRLAYPVKKNAIKSILVKTAKLN